MPGEAAPCDPEPAWAANRALLAELRHDDLAALAAPYRVSARLTSHQLRQELSAIADYVWGRRPDSDAAAAARLGKRKAPEPDDSDAAGR